MLAHAAVPIVIRTANLDPTVVAKAVALWPEPRIKDYTKGRTTPKIQELMPGLAKPGTCQCHGNRPR